MSIQTSAIPHTIDCEILANSSTALVADVQPEYTTQ